MNAQYFAISAFTQAPRPDVECEFVTTSDPGRCRTSRHGASNFRLAIMPLELASYYGIGRPYDSFMRGPGLDRGGSSAFFDEAFRRRRAREDCMTEITSVAAAMRAGSLPDLETRIL